MHNNRCTKQHNKIGILAKKRKCVLSLTCCLKCDSFCFYECRQMYILTATNTSLIWVWLHSHPLQNSGPLSPRSLVVAHRLLWGNTTRQSVRWGNRSPPRQRRGWVTPVLWYPPSAVGRVSQLSPLSEEAKIRSGCFRLRTLAGIPHAAWWKQKSDSPPELQYFRLICND